MGEPLAAARLKEDAVSRFDALEFFPHQSGRGVRAKVFFPNGYGASVVQSPYSYGGESGLYELGVLIGDKSSFRLCYDTPITQDVEGNLIPGEVGLLLLRIEALPAVALQANEVSGSP